MADQTGYTLEEIDSFILALAENASALINDAKVLFEAESFARAHALAHLAREELARITMLQAVACRSLASLPIDWKKTKKRLRNHRAKIIQETIDFALFHASNGNAEGSKMLTDHAGGIATLRNNWKNEALYVNFKDGEAVVPTSAFSRDQADRCIQSATAALGRHRETISKIGRFSGRAPVKLPHPIPFFDGGKETLHRLVMALAPVYSMIVNQPCRLDQQGDSSSAETPHPPASAPASPSSGSPSPPP